MLLPLDHSCSLAWVNLEWFGREHVPALACALYLSIFCHPERRRGMWEGRNKGKLHTLGMPEDSRNILYPAHLGMTKIARPKGERERDEGGLPSDPLWLLPLPSYLACSLGVCLRPGHSAQDVIECVCKVFTFASLLEPYLFPSHPSKPSSENHVLHESSPAIIF